MNKFDLFAILCAKDPINSAFVSKNTRYCLGNVSRTSAEVPRIRLKMANGYYRMADAELNQSIGLTANTLIEDFGAYGLSEEEALALAADTVKFGASIRAAAEAEAAKRAAVQAKDADRLALLRSISSISGKLYANANLSDAMLAGANLSPRPTHSGPRPIMPAKELFVAPYPNGEILLHWNPNDNPASVTFLIEARVGESDQFTFLAATPRKRLRLPGFPPGQKVVFRVIATRGTQSSSPSNLATIYGDGSFAEIQAAA